MHLEVESWEEYLLILNISFSREERYVQLSKGKNTKKFNAFDIGKVSLIIKYIKTLFFWWYMINYGLKIRSRQNCFIKIYRFALLNANMNRYRNSRSILRAGVISILFNPLVEIRMHLRKSLFFRQHMLYRSYSYCKRLYHKITLDSISMTGSELHSSLRSLWELL